MPAAACASDDRDMTWDHEVQRLVERGRDREAAALADRRLSSPPTEGERMHPLELLDHLGPALGGVVGNITAEQLDAETPCTELTVRGVLEHMITGATAFAAAFRGEEPAAPSVDAVRDPVAGFGAAMEGLARSMHAPGALDRTVAAPFGDVPGEAFARFVVLDGLVHGWDLATATNQRYQPDGALVAEVDAFARQAIAPSMRDAGMFAAEVDPSPDASPIESLVAFTGRPTARSSA
jgi:uncharacterized protein (TIGR03086 family)